MNGYASQHGRFLIVAVGLAVAMAACKDSTPTTPPTTTSYVETRLVADKAGSGAMIVDADLRNPWGLAFGSTGVLWVANNHTGTSTLYDANGGKIQTVVGIPSKDHPTDGSPTGLIYNAGNNFMIPEVGKSVFIFAGEDGTISAWAPGMANARIVADRSAYDAVYKGIAMATDGTSEYLYLTNFRMNAVDVFDANFAYVRSFTDATIPTNYAPFGIRALSGKLYVTYARQKGPDNEDDQPGAGNGYVDIFNSDGTMNRRFASGGALNSPWAIVMAPTGFGTYSGDILIGNFGDGRISAYDPATGSYLGQLHDVVNQSMAIEGLWDLVFGPNGSTTLYYSAGPNDEEHGLLGTLKPM